jgi:hypothetical protein
MLGILANWLSDRVSASLSIKASASLSFKAYFTLSGENVF